MKAIATYLRIRLAAVPGWATVPQTRGIDANSPEGQLLQKAGRGGRR